MSVPKTHPDVAQEDVHAPRPLTVVENVVLTLKVVAGLGMLGGVLWAAKLWVMAR
jgi:hypothetical protein